MILCESPWQNEPGRETIAKDDPQCKLYNKSLYPHTIQTAMLDWLEKREFGKPEAPGRWGAGRTVAKPAAAKLETTNIWADIVKLHFDDNAKDIISEQWEGFYKDSGAELVQSNDPETVSRLSIHSFATSNLYSHRLTHQRSATSSRLSTAAPTSPKQPSS